MTAFAAGVSQALNPGVLRAQQIFSSTIGERSSPQAVEQPHHAATHVLYVVRFWEVGDVTVRTACRTGARPLIVWECLD